MIEYIRRPKQFFLAHNPKRKKEVTAFLNELNELLTSDNFNVETDLTIISKKKPNDEEHSTPYTIVDLEYDSEDVANRLKELSISEYSETKIDKDDLVPPLLFVFGKVINHKLVYIKLKIKENATNKRRVLCVSFHYVQKEMNFPYK